MCVCGGGTRVSVRMCVCTRVSVCVYVCVCFPCFCVHMCAHLCVCVVLMVIKEQMSRGKGKSDEAKVSQATGLFQTQAGPPSTGGGAVTTTLDAPSKFGGPGPCHGNTPGPQPLPLTSAAHLSQAQRLPCGFREGLRWVWGRRKVGGRG